MRIPHRRNRRCQPDRRCSVKTGVPKEYILKTAELPLNIDVQTPARDWLHAPAKSRQDIRPAVKYAAK